MSILQHRPHYIARLWQRNDTAASSPNQLQLPQEMFSMQLRVSKISLYAQQDSSTVFMGLKSFLVPCVDLLSNDTSRLVISGALSSMGIPEDHQEPFIRRLICTLATGGTIPPIFVSIVVLTISQRPYDETEATSRAIRESMEVETLNLVPTINSSIEVLEKVRLDDSSSMEQCMICLEKFSDIGFEVTRMPCSHVYHGNCIVQWLKTSHFCPLCRFPMPC